MEYLFVNFSYFYPKIVVHKSMAAYAKSYKVGILFLK